MESIWQQTAARQQSEPLRKSVKTDVLVIGGGITGLLCAYVLQRAGVDTVLVEANTLCSGITQNTTAKLTSQHGLLYQSLVRRFGLERARLYLDANEEALGVYRTLCREIACGYEEADAYVYSSGNLRKIEKELGALQQLGFAAAFKASLPLPFPVAGAVMFPHQAQFHPLQFAYALAEGLRIYEHTPVRSLVGTVAVTDYARITADNVIVATHFPFLNKHGSYFLKLYQHRSYVLTLEHTESLDGMYVDEAPGGISMRRYGDLLLLGGGGHRTGKNGSGYNALRAFAAEHYNGAAERTAWATQDCMTLDGVPYIGRYSANTKGLYVATGFNKWGMSSAMVAALLLCDLIRGVRNPYEAVFSPSRSIFRPQLAVNALEAALHLLTPTRPRCPHLGCALQWNRAEHSWDCPCHGSRFTAQGKLLDNPATGDCDISGCRKKKRIVRNTGVDE